MKCCLCILQNSTFSYLLSPHRDTDNIHIFQFSSILSHVSSAGCVLSSTHLGPRISPNTINRAESLPLDYSLLDSLKVISSKILFFSLLRILQLVSFLCWPKSLVVHLSLLSPHYWRAPARPTIRVATVQAIGHIRGSSSSSHSVRANNNNVLISISISVILF